MSDMEQDGYAGTGGDGQSEVPPEMPNTPGVEPDEVDGESQVPEESPTGDEGADDDA